MDQKELHEKLGRPVSWAIAKESEVTASDQVEHNDEETRPTI
jgi:hypothetical protein